MGEELGYQGFRGGTGIEGLGWYLGWSGKSKQGERRLELKVQRKEDWRES